MCAAASAQQCCDRDAAAVFPTPDPSVFLGVSADVIVTQSGALVSAAGVPPDSTPGAGSSGSADLFFKSGSSWSFTTEVYADDAEPGASFGQAVALTDLGSTILLLVGAPLDDNENGVNAGAAYVFAAPTASGTSWPQEIKLTAEGFEPSPALLGNSVGLSATTAVVGAPAADALSDPANAGAAFIFTRTSPGNWVQSPDPLLDPQPQAGAQFGHAVAIDGDVIVVGSPSKKVSGPNSGQAFVFRRVSGTWLSDGPPLTPADGQSRDQFGRSVAVSGNVIIVGAPYDDDGAADAGSVYVFRYNGSIWQQEAKLLACSAASQDYFGTSVAVGGDLAVVGAPTILDDDQNGAAHAYCFNGSAWVHSARLGSPLTDFDGQFGLAVAVGPEIALVTEPLALANQGVVYDFAFTAACAADTNCNGVVGVADLLAVLIAWGTADPDADVNCDGTVDVLDLVQVITNWNQLCGGGTGGEASICDEFLSAGLSQERCDEFLSLEDIQDASYRCWLVHYLTTCTASCAAPANCPGTDPFNTGRH